jgi:hypothetical protein
MADETHGGVSQPILRILIVLESLRDVLDFIGELPIQNLG